jgi:hypothetical protein
MDTIALSKFGDTEEESAITFLVKGRDLIDIIFDHDGIALGLPLRVVSQERRFTLFTERISSVPERLVVLASEQGWSGVTAATAVVQWAESTVTWSELAPAWRGRPTKIPQIGPFTFERRQYEDVLAMGRQLSDEWRVRYAGARDLA